MRTLQLLLAVLLITSASAQLINGSFEDGLTGWSTLDGAYLTSDAAPDEGGSGLRISAGQLFVNWATQIIPGLEAGMVVHLSGWAKAPSGFVWQQGMFGICDCDAFPSNPSQLALVVESGNWTYLSGTVELDPVQNFCLFLSGTYSAGSAIVPDIFFDGLSVEIDPSTEVMNMDPNAQPHVRPNPATDQLWVDLPEVPASLILIDAAGRTLDVKNFTHQQHTLQLDVSNASPGLNTLLIRTSTGTRSLRFIKN